MEISEKHNNILQKPCFKFLLCVYLLGAQDHNIREMKSPTENTQSCILLHQKQTKCSSISVLDVYREIKNHQMQQIINKNANPTPTHHIMSYTVVISSRLQKK